MPSAIFQFFEIIAEELCSRPSQVITRVDLQLDDENAPLLDDLRDETKTRTGEDAIRAAIIKLAEHFRSKNSILPFSYDPASGRFMALNLSYLEFIMQMKNIRSNGQRSRDFELGVMERLKDRVTGSLHRVGHPGDVKRKRDEFNAHLKTLGFNGNVLVQKDKDGGLDILWILPLGTIPHRPIVSIQCKNGKFKMDECARSVSTMGISLNQHAGLQRNVHVPCVLFNDYLYPEVLTSKAIDVVPLGLTDVAPIALSIETITI